MSTERARPANLAAAAWWRGAVIYQIYPRSFADSNGDGIGDLPGITAHLEHVASLGVDAIWLSPFYPSPMADFGYDVADYCDVDPLFGNLAGFDALVSEAHRRGLKIIVDFGSWPNVLFEGQLKAPGTPLAGYPLRTLAPVSRDESVVRAIQRPGVRP